ncbi:MAG: glycosyltransferase [Bryobacteraceae bacterium]
MDLLFVHNHYQQPGGEDRAFESEVQSLALRGHRVLRHEVHNTSIGARPLKAAVGTIWNWDAYRKMRSLLRQERPQLIHAHNTFPLYSPSIYYAARAEGVPVVQTLHNYRLLCPAATLCRSGEICTKCVQKPIAWPAVQHRCYRDSRAGSAVVSTMLAVHRALRTWHKLVDAYILPTEFGKQTFLNAGFPPEKLFVKPNFCEFPIAKTQETKREGGLFVGRLSPEKGIEVMLDAWRAVDRSIPLRIVGDGPLRDIVQRAAARMENVHYLGWLGKAEIEQQMRASAFLVVPSIWYEVFGINVIEAYSMGFARDRQPDRRFGGNYPKRRNGITRPARRRRGPPRHDPMGGEPLNGHAANGRRSA